MTGDKSEANKNDGATIDHNSPYYLHPSDYPRQLHVNDVLTDGNYIDWSQEMLNFLFAKNKVGFIDGSIKKPESASPTYMAWMRCDAMLKGWLNTAMEKEIRTSVKYAATAQEIWTDLKERFGKINAPRAYELKQSLVTIKQERTSVSAYYTRLRSIWDEIQSVLPVPICSCNGCTCEIGKKLNNLKENERLYEFLLGLDSEFGTIRTQILAMQPTPSLGTAYHLVAEDEQQRAITGERRPTTDAAAFQAFVPKKKDHHNPPQSKFTKRDGKRNEGEQLKFCDLCKKHGHVKEGCFKIIGYPEWWPGKAKQEKPKAACVEGEASKMLELTDEQYQQVMKLFGEKLNATKEQEPSIANMAGLEFEDLDWNG